MFDKIIIIDQSATMPETEVIQSGNPKAYFPVFSKKGYGKDSALKFFNGGQQAAMIAKLGKGDLTTYLAPMYYAYEFLRGGGDAYIRRIVSPTSTLAHAVIIAKGKVDTETSKYNVKFVVQTIVDGVDADTIIAGAEALYSATEDADGYKTYPIAVIGLNWSGVAGNSYTFRLLPNKNLEKLITQRGYSVQITPDSTTSPATVDFSTHPDAAIEGSSVYCGDIFDTKYPDVYFTMLNTYQTFLTAIATYIPTGETYPDIFFGKKRSDNSVYPNYTIVSGSADFTAVGGISLAAGDDGSFAVSETGRVDAMMTQLGTSFTEDTTKMLQNEYKYFVDFVFDFNAADTVKAAIMAFIGTRQTTSSIMDTGILKTKVAILADRASGDSASYNNMRASLFGGVAAAIDPFTNKKITMPLSYFEAYAIPNHILTYEGGSRPFAGDYYKYPNMLPGTYQPNFYSEDDPDLVNFVDNQINMAFEDTNGYTAYHQTTSMKTPSTLNERNNIYILHRLIRICLLTAKAERWNFAEDSDIEKYEAKITRNVAFELDGKFGSFELKAKRAGDIGPDRNRVAVEATIRFKYINKGTTFTFTVV